jgi:hypothetical protein
MNTWNTLQESNHQSVYSSILATVKPAIQKAENPMAAVVINMEAESVDNIILHEDVPCEVGPEEPGIEQRTQTS